MCSGRAGFAKAVLRMIELPAAFEGAIWAEPKPIMGNKNLHTILTAAWVIWCARNNYIHDDIKPCIRNVAASINSYKIKALDMHPSAEICLAKEHICSKPWAPLLLHWFKPQVGEVKLNLDGSFKREEERASLGGIFWDHTEKCLLHFSLPIVAANPLQTEFLACYWGLRLAVAHGWKVVWLESNSKSLVNAINSQQYIDTLWEVLITYKAIRVLLSGMQWRCNHGFRETNKIADALAGRASLSNMGVMGYTTPPWLKILLHGDEMNLSYLRCK